MVVYFESVHLGVGTHDSQSSKFSAREKDFQIPLGSPFVLSFCESVQLGACLSRFCPLWSPATWHSLQIGLCPLLVLSTLDFAHIWFCLLGIMFMKEYFYLRSCTLGILFTWVFDYLDSVHLGVCPYDSQSTKFCARDKVLQISSGSPLVLSLLKSV